MGQRIEGIDVARGLASLIMIQGHAYHGWVAPAHHDAAYAFTRVLGTLPLPAFLVLAGAAVVLRLEAAARRNEDPRAVRRALTRRGLTLVLIGYAANAAYALIDGAAGLHTWLRADVLHVIGSSLALAAWVGIPLGVRRANVVDTSTDHHTSDLDVSSPHRTGDLDASSPLHGSDLVDAPSPHRTSDLDASSPLHGSDLVDASSPHHGSDVDVSSPHRARAPSDALGAPRIDPTRFAIRVSLLGLALTLLSPWLSPIGAHVPAPLMPLAALFVDAPPFTAMPVVPLFAWLAFGALAASWLAKRRGDDAISRRAGSSLHALAAMAIFGLVLAALASRATDALVAALPGPLTRAHVAVIPNVLDLVGRGFFVLALGAALSLVLPSRVRAAFVTLGRGSLVAYVVHIPFCYGKLAGPLLGQSDMTRATLALPFLIALSWLVVYARDGVRERLRARAAS